MLHQLGKCFAEDSKSKDSKVDESKRERVSIEELLNKKSLSIDDFLNKKSKTVVKVVKAVRQGRAKSINYSDFYDYVRSYKNYNKDVRGE